ncbi:MAG: tripartite tricarboxylate transporter substrate binding protein [Planctomycetota bacterium]|nr:tripartite tricarboxylate transporter substrate binding protein [Planctomycetota bacterium]
MNRMTVLVFACGISSGVFAQEYPTRPVRIVVPFAAGGAADISARGISPGLAEILRQNVIIDNRPGAGGTIGAEYVAKATPDGYTLLLGSNSTLSVAPSLYPRIRYNSVRDFFPITLLATTPLVLAIHPSVPAKNIKEFIAIGKAKPKILTMASGGLGSMNQMTGELFQSLTGVKFIHVPFKGSAPAVVGLISGEVDMIFDQLATSITHINAGKLRALGVTSKTRNLLLPQVPTMAESGIANYLVTSITGLLVPTGTPSGIVDKLNTATLNVLKNDDVKARFSTAGLEVHGSTPQEFSAFIKDDLSRWTKVVKETNISVE